MEYDIHIFNKIFNTNSYWKKVDLIIYVVFLTKENEHSIAAYFQKYLNADLSNPMTRDPVFDYLIDKNYLYDDRLEITGFFTEDRTTVTWDQLQDGEIGFVSFAPLSTHDSPKLKAYGGFLLK